MPDPQTIGPAILAKITKRGRVTTSAHATLSEAQELGEQWEAATGNAWLAALTTYDRDEPDEPDEPR